MSSPRSPKRAKTETTFRVAFQGGTGAFSEIAGKKSFSKRTNANLSRGDVTTVGKPSFKEVFEAVENGEVEAGIVPIENSISGTLKEILAMLVAYENVVITGETCEVESVCICAAKGASLEDITAVHSDAHHLAQCSDFLDQLDAKVQRCVEWDSAGACEVVKGDKTKAACASRDAAKLHGLQVLKQNVSNLGGLATRYVIIADGKAASKKGTPGLKLKSSIAVLLRNEPMALMKLVSAFALRGMNITKLESQPACQVKNDMFSGRHFDYLFFVDFEPKDAAATKCLMANIEEFAQSIRHLGTYPKNIALQDLSHEEMPWTSYIH